MQAPVNKRGDEAKTTQQAIKRRKPRRDEHLSPELTDTQKAVRNFERLGRVEQLQLSHEIALTRQAELLLAYDNLVGVGSGYRTRRDARGGKPRLVHEPCVTFIVKRKWRTAGKKGDPQALPPYLLGIATLGAQRVLSAVPTDVRIKSDFAGAIVRDGDIPRPFGLLVDPGPAFDFTIGVGTCAIRRPADPGSTFVMSCRHVLGCSHEQIDLDRTALTVEVDSTAEALLGRTLGIRGRLAAGGVSFDAQLASVANGQALARAFQGIDFDAGDGYLKKPGDVDKGFWIATGRRAPDGGRLLVWVTYHGTLLDHEMPYTIGGRKTSIVHRLILYGESESELVKGDSGSPAIRLRRGQRLIGMYIGGPSNTVYVLPAWQLMTPSNLGRPNESGWTLAV